MNIRLTDEELDKLLQKIKEGSGFYIQYGRRPGAITMANLLLQAGFAALELRDRRKADEQKPISSWVMCSDGLPPTNTSVFVIFARDQALMIGSGCMVSDHPTIPEGWAVSHGSEVIDSPCVVCWLMMPEIPEIE